MEIILLGMIPIMKIPKLLDLVMLIPMEWIVVHPQIIGTCNTAMEWELRQFLAKSDYLR